MVSPGPFLIFTKEKKCTKEKRDHIQAPKKERRIQKKLLEKYKSILGGTKYENKKRGHRGCRSCRRPLCI